MNDLHEPWLIAAWPGMGGVAQIAAGFLAQTLDAKRLDAVDLRTLVEPRAVDVRSGLVQRAASTHAAFHAWKNPTGGRDLLFYLANEQPEREPWTYCNRVMALAKELGARRVITFAAMGTPIEPRAEPRVFAVATSAPLLEELVTHGAEPLGEGQISGLNGLVLAAAAEQRIEAVCLLGEFPYFAAAIANPKASSAVLRVFERLAGVLVDRKELDAHVPAVEAALDEALEKLRRASEPKGEPAMPAEGEEWKHARPVEPRPTMEEARRIEQLFERASRDKGQALALKSELDRLGVFKRYEDRFLDLFKQAG
ncbi:MAG: PAC2 family protein [Planctomycetes bacterium]|nr:PAC2 family protein [Planctomycetota bacterium]